MARQGRSTAQRAAMAIVFAAATAAVVRVVAIPTAPAVAAAPHAASAAFQPTIPRQTASASTAAPRRPAAITPVSPPRSTPVAIRRVIDTGGPIRYGQWFWDDPHGDGAITIAVDLKASVLSIFRGGDEIGTTAIIYGADDRETPLGTFPILQKDRHHFSSRYHHAPMPYMLRLTPDGISIHASEVAADYATHGCIGVPDGFARKLFETAAIGDRVIITNRGSSAA